MLYDLADGLVAVAVALSPYLPETAPQILEALGQPATCRWTASRPQAAEAAEGIEPAPPLFPRIDAPTPRVIDTHAHLDACDDPRRAPSRARGRPASPGSSRSARRSSAAATRSRSPTRHEGVFAILGIHPHEAGDARATDSTSCASCSRHPRAVAVGETGLDFYRDHAPRDRQRRLFERSSTLAAELGKPVVDPHARRGRGHGHGRSRGFDGTVVLHCFSSPGAAARSRSSAATTSRSPATSPIPKASELRVAATQVPADRILAETDSPYLAPQPVRGRPNEPANVVHTLAAPGRGARGRPGRRSRRRSTRTRRPRSGCRERAAARRSSASTSSSTRTSSA